MPLTNAGRNHIAANLIAEAVTEFNNANTHIGVGDSAAAFAAAQTDLQASTNKFRRPMEATYPSRASNIITVRSLYATSEANFTWSEWGVFNALSGGIMLSRKVDALGTKPSTQAWQLTGELTINNT